MGNFPYFIGGKLLFCNGGLAASCCGLADDPTIIPGWDDYGYIPDGYVFKEDKPAMIGALCPVKDCNLGGTPNPGGKFQGIGDILAYPADLTEEQMRLFVDYGSFYIVPLKGPFADMADAIAVMQAHDAALRDYATHCVCITSWRTICDPFGGQNLWFADDDDGGYWEQMTCGWGRGAGPGPGDDARYVVAEWETYPNEYGVSFEFMLKRNGGSWERFGNSGSWEGILFPCDQVRFGGSVGSWDNAPPGVSGDAHDYGRFEGEMMHYGSRQEDCTPAIQAAFDAVPDSSE